MPRQSHGGALGRACVALWIGLASACSAGPSEPTVRAAIAPRAAATPTVVLVSDVEPAASTTESAAVAPEAPAPATEPSGPAKPRIYSIGQTTWIRRKPEVTEGQFLGYVRTGHSIALRSNEKVPGNGCPKGFYQVEPRGFVCDDTTVTASPRTGFKLAAAATMPEKGPFPYHYALSDGTPMYNRVPTKAEQARYEPAWAYKPGVFHKLPKTLRSHEELAASEPIPKTTEVPSFLRDGGSAKEAPYDLVEQMLPIGAMVSYTAAFEAEGRTWLLSTDHTIVAADRVRPFKPTTFKGVDLAKGEGKLPLAFFRKKPRAKLKKQGDGFEKTAETWPVKGHVELTGQSAEHGGKRYLETREELEGARLWVAEADATVIERETELPPGVKAKQKWFSIRLGLGTLVAYDDLEPTYATLVSPGRGGLPTRGKDPVEASTTPTGAYSITFKDRAATMSHEKGKNRTFWIQDVPWTQYFDPPFALHAAFWHERFGEFTSAGCVNLAPLDAMAMFAWSDPPVPEGWQGATGAGAKENGATTIVIVRR